MPSTAVIRDAVAAYVKAVAAGNADDIVARYAPEATVEDPVGSAVRHGRDEIRGLYAALENVHIETELITVRVGGSSAVFHFRVRTELPDQIVEIEPIDVMTFADDGLITSMRAFWSPEDVRSTPR